MDSTTVYDGDRPVRIGAGAGSRFACIAIVEETAPLGSWTPGQIGFVAVTFIAAIVMGAIW